MLEHVLTVLTPGDMVSFTRCAGSVDQTHALDCGPVGRSPKAGIPRCYTFVDLNDGTHEEVAMSLYR
jgi:hypothetical protein